MSSKLNNKIYDELYKRVTLSNNDNDLVNYLQTVNEVVEYSLVRTKNTISVLSQFTLHDEVHLSRVLVLMERLIGEDNITNLSDVDLGILIMVAHLHDIGMSPDEKKINIWKKGWDEDLNGDEKSEFDKFRMFCKQKRDKYIELLEFSRQRNINKFNSLLGNFIANYIRENHAYWAYEIIDSKNFPNICYKNADLKKWIAKLCESHNEDVFKLKENFKEIYFFGDDRQKDITCLIYIGVLLRLADILDFDSKRTPSVLYEN